MPSAMPISNMFDQKKLEKDSARLSKISQKNPQKSRPGLLSNMKKLELRKISTINSVDETDSYIGYLVGPTLTMDGAKPHNMIKIIEN